MFIGHLNTRQQNYTHIQIGLRFGNKRETYLEFKKKLRLKKRSDFGVEFKTSEADGIIFYIADEKNSDFIALFVKNGKLVYGFNCGSGPVYIESPQPINDGRYELKKGWKYGAKTYHTTTTSIV